MAEEGEIHDTLERFGIVIVSFLGAFDFWSIQGEYVASDLIASIPKRSWSRYLAASKAKNAKVWQILAERFIPGFLEDGAKDIAKTYALAYPKPKSIEAYADMYVRQHGGDFITQMGWTDKKKLTDFIWSNSAQHERPLKKAIYQQPHLRYVLDQGNHRTETIVRTEKMRGVNYGGWRFASDNGAKTKTRWEVGDKRTRPSHRAMMGETVAIDKPYSNGEQYPGESSINCRGKNIYNFR